MAKERALAMRQLWRLLALLLRVEFDNVVDAQHGDGGLGGELDHLHLGDGRLDYAGGQVVLDVARDAVEPVPAKLGLGRVGLRGVVVGAQLGDDVGGVLRGVDSELLRDDEERLGKLCDGELLARAERGGEVLEVDGEGRLYAAATGDHGGRLERALDGTHGVVERALDLVEHVRVGAAQQQRRRALRLAPLHHEVVVVADALLEHLVGDAEHRRVEALVALHVGQRDHHRAACELGNAAEVLLLAPAQGDASALDKVLEGHVVDALRRQDDVGARVDQQLDALLGNVCLTLADLLQLRRVRDHNRDPHGHLGLAQVNVEKGDLCPLDVARHALGGTAAKHGVSLQKTAVLCGAAVLLHNVYRFHWVESFASVRVDILHHGHGINGKIRKEVAFAPKDLGGERGLRDLKADLATELVGLHDELIFDVFDRFFHCQAVPSHHRCRMN
mmetsp:Transcript_16557/g.35515  ORF Transcript_16557/g.35515 Transcript_16557/m.35515 type:complete len:446 (-) Transcript_16557:361-1698(-)